ncbi:hypothetical protein OESDEN_13872 [Oesophagostomum dentatum]|uniref:Uncharacterized protein n=1 Tax=Oesophagostomum dentatum TaxID=61180 RepID=A0A0B1SS69_OESDE|nr:hypothetical protein OESDEN_13872 [Oesophagostomum dentatum]
MHPSKYEEAHHSKANRRQEIRQKSEGLTKYQLKKKLLAAKDEVARELAEGKIEKPCIPSRRGRFVGEPKTMNEEAVVTYPSAANKAMFYVFSKCKSTRSYDIYECLLCRRNGKSTSVKACGYEFYRDPSTLPHNCDPVENLDALTKEATDMDAEEVNDTPAFIIFTSESNGCVGEH